MALSYGCDMIFPQKLEQEEEKKQEFERKKVLHRFYGTESLFCFHNIGIEGLGSEQAQS